MSKINKTDWDIIESYGAIYTEESMNTKEPNTTLTIHNRQGDAYCYIDYCNDDDVVPYLPQLSDKLRDTLWLDILTYENEK